MSTVRAGVIGALLALLVALPIAWNHEQGLNRMIGLERDGREAQADTTRRLALALHVLADGTQAVQRRVVQEQQRADALDRALGLERKARFGLGIQVAKLDTSGTAAQRAGDQPDVRYIDLDIKASRTQPFTLRGTIVSYPLPQPAHWDLTLALEPIPLRARLGCGAPVRENNGVRPAQFTVEAPAWARVTIENATQDDAICNQKKSSWATDWKTLTLTGLVLILGLAK